MTISSDGSNNSLSTNAILEMIRAIFFMSDDPDTQVAAMLYFPNGSYIVGANSFPTGVLKHAYRKARPIKYQYIQHAEQTVVAEAARTGKSLAGASMFLSWFPCASCAGLIINSGITSLYVDENAYQARKTDPRYGFADSVAMLKEAGIQIFSLQAMEPISL